MKYELMLENEVRVTREEIKKIFDKKRVFVAGYGSLLYSRGWDNRGMTYLIWPADMRECLINGYERGPFGFASSLHFYGVIANPEQYLNVTLVEIHTMRDWVNLMSTELIAGMFYNYNYRVVDVTSKVSGIKLPKNAVVHMVANEPQNRSIWRTEYPCPGYYERVWRGVQAERSDKFIKTFRATGGLTAAQARRKFNPNLYYA